MRAARRNRHSKRQSVDRRAFLIETYRRAADRTETGPGPLREFPVPGFAGSRRGVFPSRFVSCYRADRMDPASPGDCLKDVTHPVRCTYKSPFRVRQTPVSSILSLPVRA